MGRTEEVNFGDAVVPVIHRLSVIGIFVLAVAMLRDVQNASAQEQNSLPVMPLPSHSVSGEGGFLIDGTFGIALKGYTEPRMERARQRFLDTLSRETGIPLWREAAVNPPHFTLQIAGPSRQVQQLGRDESYRLEISSTHIQLTAPGPARRDVRI